MTSDNNQPTRTYFVDKSPALTGEEANQIASALRAASVDPDRKAAMGAEMYAAIPGSYLWVIPNGGHGPIFGDMAANFAETALVFLRGGWKADSQA